MKNPDRPAPPERTAATWYPFDRPPLRIVKLARCPVVPIAAYNVSGEYTMLLSAAAGDAEYRERLVLEALTCIKRAGADMIITYFAREVAQILGR